MVSLPLVTPKGSPAAPSEALALAFRVQAIEHRLTQLADDIAGGTDSLGERRLRALTAQATDLDRSLWSSPLRLAGCRTQALLLRARLAEPPSALEAMLARRHNLTQGLGPGATVSQRMLALADEVTAVGELLVARGFRGRASSAAVRHPQTERRAALRTRLLRSASQLSRHGLMYCLTGMAGYLDLNSATRPGGALLPGDLMVGFGIPVLMLPVRRALVLAQRQALAVWPRLDSSEPWEPPWNDTTPCSSGPRPPTARLPATPPAPSGARVRRLLTSRLPRVRSPSPHWSARRR